MGLDWRPMGKPSPGSEERFIQLFRFITGTEKQTISLLDRLKGKKPATHEQLLEEWFSIQIPSYETIQAPRVGRDPEADEWIKDVYEKGDYKIPLQEFVDKHQGFYVIDLAKEQDGVPVYRAFGQDENVFRGKFLDFCKDLMGERLYNSAWETKLAPDTLQYGQELMTIADSIAADNNLAYLKEQKAPPEAAENSMEAKLHILYAAAKWLIFYGSNGHGYEADF